jgi:hypothetical protein
MKNYEVVITITETWRERYITPAATFGEAVDRAVTDFRSQYPDTVTPPYITVKETKFRVL